MLFRSYFFFLFCFFVACVFDIISKKLGLPWWRSAWDLLKRLLVDHHGQRFSVPVYDAVFGHLCGLTRPVPGRPRLTQWQAHPHLLNPVSFQLFRSLLGFHITKAQANVLMNHVTFHLGSAPFSLR